MVMGVSYEEFWTLNPRKLNVIVEAYKLRKRVIDEQQWMLGSYVFDGVSIALGNASRKKGQKSKSYFELVKQPMWKQIEQADGSGMTEEEKKQKTELLFKGLEVQMANFNLKKHSKE